MKKIYAILAAALMSISLFAAPTKADLGSYMEEGYYVVCFQAPTDGSTCQDIYWMGTYADWNIATPLQDLVKCEELTGANAGWYVAKVPAGESNNGKPIQLDQCGDLSWSGQCGDPEAIEVLEGSVDIAGENGTESSLTNWSTTEPNIITIAYWKEHFNPCNEPCAQQPYTFILYDPYCEYLPEIVPTIQGNFTNWATEVAVMKWNDDESRWEYTSKPITEKSLNGGFKFNNDPNGKWDHEFEYYDEENDNWSKFTNNLTLADEGKWFTRKGNTLTFDWSDDTKYRYAGCVAPEEAEYTILYVKLPELNRPEAVEIIGTFDGWAGTAMELLDNGYHFVELQAEPSQFFKFRSAGSWDQELEIYNTENDEWGTIGDGQLTFGQLWVDDTYKNTPCKLIDLDDWSNPEMYRWKVKGEEGIENVVLTEKAKKVIVDGVMYIVRDGKMFNVQGAQVR